jgi:hypothetical protein
MHTGFSTLKAIMTPNHIKEMFTHTSEITGLTQSSKFSIPSLESSLKASNTERLMVKAAKKLTGPFLIVRWASSKDGTINKIHKPSKKSRTFSKLSIGKSLEVDLLNMIKEAHTMMISLKTFKQDSHS